MFVNGKISGNCEDSFQMAQRNVVILVGGWLGVTPWEGCISRVTEGFYCREDFDGPD